MGIRVQTGNRFEYNRLGAFPNTAIGEYTHGDVTFKVFILVPKGGSATERYKRFTALFNAACVGLANRREIDQGW
jgi:hypothetical protein